jgi:hypothetical protein
VFKCFVFHYEALQREQPVAIYVRFYKVNKERPSVKFLLRAIFKYSGKANGARASETGLSGKADQL